MSVLSVFERALDRSVSFMLLLIGMISAGALALA